LGGTLYKTPKVPEKHQITQPISYDKGQPFDKIAPCLTQFKGKCPLSHTHKPTEK